MATQTIQFEAPSLSQIGSGTITAVLYSGATVVGSLSGIAENGTRPGRYTGTVADKAEATYDLIVRYNGYDVSDPGYQVALLLAEGTYVAAMASTSNESGTGTGARTVTITVNDGSTVLQNARVRLTEGANTYTGLTNASGVVTLNVDDATYTVAITKIGYSYAGTTLVVDGTEAVTYSMTTISVTPPDDPALCAVTIHLRNQYGVDLEGEPVEITWVKWDAGASETPPVLSVPPVQETSANGLVQVNLYRDAVYKIIYGNAPYARRIDATIPDAGSHEIEV